jgi:EAL domain-containing protein (putative c-di-GMP-specific phosphodiesterase class I)
MVIEASPTGIEAQLEQAISHLRQGFSQPLKTDLHQVSVTLSLGVALFPQDARDGCQLISAAEMACRRVRNKGGNHTGRFDPASLERARAAFELETDLRHAIEHEEFRLVYQPKVRLPDCRLSGVEALLRWQHPIKGFISPERFIPLAERSGLIIPLGHWVMREACRQIATWRSAGLTPPTVAVNVSPRQLVEGSLRDLLAPLEEFAVPCDLIEIEITEGAMMDVLHQTAGLLETLRTANLRVTIDDFGAGHSSLGSLRRLPISVFKIDKSLVEDTATSQQARDIVATIIAMAKALSLEVIAEGVETELQAGILQDLGASIMQGYLFAKPMTAEEVVAYRPCNPLNSLRAKFSGEPVSFQAPLPQPGNGSSPRAW